MRVQGIITEPASIGEKARRAESATVVDRVASNPAPFKTRRDAAFAHPPSRGYYQVAYKIQGLHVIV